MLFLLRFWGLLALAAAQETAELPSKAVRMDALLAKVGRESVSLTDLQRFREVDKVLACAGIVKRPAELPDQLRPLLDAYIDEELIYLEARSHKLSIAGMLQESVRTIHKTAACKSNWQSLGEKYGKFWRTPSRPREGESQLVRELEKRLLVERFRKNELNADSELWRREVKARYVVKVYLD